jgi:hypothetical protein
MFTHAVRSGIKNGQKISCFIFEHSSELLYSSLYTLYALSRLLIISLGLSLTLLDAIIEIVERNVGFAASSHIAFLLSSFAFTIRTIVTSFSSFLLEINLFLGHINANSIHLNGLIKFFQCHRFIS